MSTQQKLYRAVLIGVMAAMIFVVTALIKIEIPTPTGTTMLKTGNILCLLSGMLFGGLPAGLAAGIGSALFDLTNPVFAPSAPFTLINFFVMGFVCGTVSHLRGKKGGSMRQNLLGAVLGAACDWVLYIGKSTLTLVLAGSAPGAALIANSAKMLTSLINGVLAVVCSMLIVRPVRAALAKAHLLEKL